MKKILFALFLVTSFSMMTACNTFEGVGKDVERGGEKVQDTAKDVKKKM